MNTAQFPKLLLLFALLLILAALLAGCSTPTSIRAEYEHVSHPFAGPPFGPMSEEDALDTINVVGRWQQGRFYTELNLGYVLADGGFYGPKLTGGMRVGVELWSRDRAGSR